MFHLPQENIVFEILANVFHFPEESIVFQILPDGRFQNPDTAKIDLTSLEMEIFFAIKLSLNFFGGNILNFLTELLY